MSMTSPMRKAASRRRTGVAGARVAAGGAARPTQGSDRTSAPVVPKLRLGASGLGAASRPGAAARAAEGSPRASAARRSVAAVRARRRDALSLGVPAHAGSYDLGAQLEMALRGRARGQEPERTRRRRCSCRRSPSCRCRPRGGRRSGPIAMQENARLRMALFDAESALESLPPKDEAGGAERGPRGAGEASADDEMQWRELCTSHRARAHDEEKAALLEELNRVRADLGGRRAQSGTTQDDAAASEVEANKARANAENWRAQFERAQEEFERLSAQLGGDGRAPRRRKLTARGTEQNSAMVVVAFKDATRGATRRRPSTSRRSARARRSSPRCTTRTSSSSSGCSRRSRRRRRSRPRSCSR